MANISEAKWKKALTAIFEKLERSQYKKMVEFYEKNQGPAQKRLTAKFKEELPEKLIQMFGMDGSISLVKEAMKEIPRNDPGVQNLLRPFVDKLGKNEENQAEGPKIRGRPEQMSNISEDVWKHNMTTIFRKLERSQYKKMVEFYEKNQGPSQKRITAKFKRELPEELFQRFGVEGSISLVNEAMKEIPRNDPGVQNLLRPFVDKLGKNQENQAEALIS
ncbi:PREDICTED: uncharacterized protein LOC107102861 [Cyprinodon variegatus]|uniref:uncharacterized protein LOC107102861 n=1 Tax=Cyprinodon variegatus TaxID=28743 RepID=UPI0007428D08|nr:PREDICTED: uncharacterized protein LOC107102861 [Cyprinodon variegatus]